MGELAEGALDKFSEFLYAVAPGFVLLFSLMYIDPKGEKLGLQLFFDEKAELRLIGIGIVLGILSYSIHLAVLEDVMESLVIWVLRGSEPDIFPPAYEASAPSYRDLTRNRWIRSAKDRSASATAQAALDETYLWQFFLYCSAYLLCFGGVFVFIQCGRHSKWWAFVAASVVSWLLGFSSDRKTTRHELWLAKAGLEWGGEKAPAYPSIEPPKVKG